MPLRANPFEAYEELFPAIDVSTIRFHGTTVTALIRNLFLKCSRRFAHIPARPRGRGRHHAGCAGAVRMARQSAGRPSGRHGIHFELDERGLAFRGEKEARSEPRT